MRRRVGKSLSLEDVPIKRSCAFADCLVGLGKMLHLHVPRGRISSLIWIGCVRYVLVCLSDDVTATVVEAFEY